MADPPVSIDDFALATVAPRPDEAGGPPPQVLRATGQPLTIVLACLVGVIVAPSALAHFYAGEYTHDGCPIDPPSSRVDSVNYVVRDWGTIDRAVNQIQYHAGWTNTSGSTQYIVDHDVCTQHDAQRASAGGISTRFHIRLEEIHYDTGVGYTSVGDAHHEDFVVSCPGHAVDSNGSDGSGFDQGRRTLRIELQNGGHDYYSKFWDNRQNMKQCDGDYARSDGYTVFSYVPQAKH